MNNMADAAPGARVTHAISEAYAFIVLQWPALLGALALEAGGGSTIARIGLMLFVVLLQVAAWRRGGAGFGNALLAAALCIAASWYLHPSAWMFAPLAAAVLLILVAQSASLRRATFSGAPEAGENRQNELSHAAVRSTRRDCQP